MSDSPFASAPPPPSPFGGQTGPATFAGEVASPGSRFGAYLINYVVIAVLGLVAFIGLQRNPILGLVLIVASIGFLIYDHIVCLGTKGQSLGKKKSGVKLLSLQTGQPVGVGPAILRAFLISILGIIDIGFLLFSGDHQRVSDKAIKANVFKA